MIFTLILAFLLLLVDQVSKMLVVGFNPNDVTVIPHLFKFNLTYNTGAAFSMFDDNTLFLAIVSLVVSIVIVYVIVKMGPIKTKKLLGISLALILSGAVGNLIDRFLTVFDVVEGVVDFVDMYLFGWHFPGTFNLADAFLCIGIVLLGIDVLFLQDRRNNKVKGTEQTREEN